MKQLSFFFLALLFPFFVFGNEITINLRTDEELFPLYISSFQAENSPLQKEYLSQLEKILKTDLENCGRVRILKQTKERENIVTHEPSWKSFDTNKWTAEGAQGVIKAKITGNHLSISSLQIQSHQIRGTQGVEITGNLAVDRTKIHFLADQLIHAFFVQKGIASSRILYTLTKKTPGSSALWETDVWECDIDGANSKKITKEGHLSVTPSYIPTANSKKAKAFLYVSYTIGQPKLYAASLHDGKNKRLTFLPGNQITPAISPKGDCIAFVSDATGNPELYLFPFNLEKGALAKPRLIFSSPKGAQGCPAFNPHGDKIAFVSNKDGKPKIYTMPIPQTGLGVPTMITKKNANNTSPSWSPDGTKLAYSAWNSGTRQIWIYDFQTKKEWQLTEGNEHKENPSWAPNSFHLVYNSATQEGGELYLINLSDKKPIKIPAGIGEKRFPSFSP